MKITEISIIAIALGIAIICGTLGFQHKMRLDAAAKIVIEGCEK